MIKPTPLLRPSPLDISGLFSGSFEALKRRFGLFVLLVLAPTIVLIGLILIASMMISGAIATFNQDAIITAVFSAAALVGIGGIAVLLLQFKVYGMMSLAAYEIAQNERPDFRGLLTRTKGFLPRMTPVILIIVGGIVAAYLVFFGLMFAMITSSMNSRGDGAAAGILVLMFLLVLAAVPVAIVLSVKLLYLIPALAIEQVGGIDAMKRSWRLTKGNFWRTLGYSILPQLAVMAISMVINTVTDFAGGAIGLRTPSSGDPSEYVMLLLALVPVLMFSMALQLAVQLFTTPFLQTYYTYMFIDQIRRDELATQQPGYGHPGYGQPGYGYPGAQPGQPYAQPGYPHQQGQPGYPHQGQQYPGQQYPPQQPGQQPPGQSGPSQNQWPGQG